MRRASTATIARVESFEREHNRGERRAAWSVVRVAHKQHCERGLGYLVNRTTRASYRAPCRNWRECSPCARSYGAVLSLRWSRVTGLRAFVVLTMPSDRGDWRVESNRREMMAAWRRLYETICRRVAKGEVQCGANNRSITSGSGPMVGEVKESGMELLRACSEPRDLGGLLFKKSSGASARPKVMHFKEHAGADGRLHLNVLWDIGWLDQVELSMLAQRAKFGPICHISRVGRERVDLTAGRAGSSASIRYSLKTGFRVVAYARKTGSQTAAGDDWPKRVRRWSATRAASRDMGSRRQSSSDWYWSVTAPPAEPEPAPERAYWLLPEEYLPVRSAVDLSAPLTFSRPPPSQPALPYPRAWTGAAE